ncbi:hypothetical protein HK096_007984 [Nowakowskiella sp. JEL0078]|nr:hypothetical protein HK096_007984 [Nowakowskiella sp. JEL0078]
MSSRSKDNLRKHLSSVLQPHNRPPSTTESISTSPDSPIQPNTWNTGQSTSSDTEHSGGYSGANNVFRKFNIMSPQNKQQRERSRSRSRSSNIFNSSSHIISRLPEPAVDPKISVDLQRVTGPSQPPTQIRRKLTAGKEYLLDKNSTILENDPTLDSVHSSKSLNTEIQRNTQTESWLPAESFSNLKQQQQIFQLGVSTPPQPIFTLSPQNSNSAISARLQHSPSLTVRHHSSAGHLSVSDTEVQSSTSSSPLGSIALSPTTKSHVSLFRQSSLGNQSSSVSLSSNSTVESANSTRTGEPVKETSIIKRDFDPTTGKKLINQYLIVKQIGRGVHGKVKLVKHVETGDLWALKIVEKNARRLFHSRLTPMYQQPSPSTSSPTPPSTPPNPVRQNPHLDKIRREIAILKKCDHPHVVRLKEVIDDPNAEKIYLVLEYMAGGDIKWHDYSEPPKPLLSLQTARTVFRDVVCGLEYLHHQGIVHRDIKPANLLWTSDRRVKISDFGVSVFIPQSKSSGSINAESPSDIKALSNNELELAKTAGSPAFFAPEVCGVVEDFIGFSVKDTKEEAKAKRLSIAKSKEDMLSNTLKKGEKNSVEIGRAIDVWALGITLYCLVFGKVPFMADTELVFPELKETDDLEDQIAVRDLLKGILEKDASKRLTLSQIKHNPWTTADLHPDARDAWFRETDPKVHFGDPVTVTDDEVLEAGFIKERIRKISSSIHSIAANLNVLRRRTKSLPSVSSEEIHRSKSEKSRPSTATVATPLKKTATISTNKIRTIPIHDPLNEKIARKSSRRSTPVTPRKTTSTLSESLGHISKTSNSTSESQVKTESEKVRTITSSNSTKPKKVFRGLTSDSSDGSLSDPEVKPLEDDPFGDDSDSDDDIRVPQGQSNWFRWGEKDPENDGNEENDDNDFDAAEEERKRLEQWNLEMGRDGS